jgi:hypothetical protein
MVPETTETLQTIPPAPSAATPVVPVTTTLARPPTPGAFGRGKASARRTWGGRRHRLSPLPAHRRAAAWDARKAAHRAYVRGG